jgi:hypothetical protein
MRTWPLYAKTGELCAFEVPNTLVGRRVIAKFLKRIPGVEVTKLPKLFSWRDDDFVHFQYGGERYIVEEPWGDNSRYLVSTETESGFVHMAEIQSWFRAYRSCAVI